MARGDAEAFARDAPRGSTLVVAGGDGTINEVVNGLLAAGGGRLALMPLGTANVLANEIGLAHPAPAARRPPAARPLAYRPASPTAAASRMMAGVGFDAHVVAGVSPRLKRLSARAPMWWRACASSCAFPFPLPRDRRRRGARGRLGHRRPRPLLWRALRLRARGRARPGELHVCLFDRGGRCARCATRWPWLGHLARLPDYRVVGRELSSKARRAIRCRATATSSPACR